MNAITRITGANGAKNFTKKSPNNIAFKGDTKLNENKKPLYVMGAGLIALGITNLALISKIIAGKNKNLDMIDNLKKTLSTISNDVTKLQQMAANQSPDKTKLRSNILNTEGMIESLLKKIQASKGLDTKYEEIARQLASLKLKLIRVKNSIDYTTSTQKLADSVSGFEKDASKLSTQLAALHPELIGATDKMGLPVDGVGFVKHGGGIARTADNKPFEGSMSFKILDTKTAKTSTVDIMTDSDGKVIRSIKRDQDGNLIFDKKYFRMTETKDGEIISATKFQTTDYDGKIIRTVQTRECTPEGEPVSFITSKTVQDGTKIVQESLFAKNKDTSKLLITTPEGKARLFIRGISDELKESLEKLGLEVDDVDKIDVVLNKPFTYLKNDACKHVDAYEIEDIFSSKIKNAIAQIEAKLKAAASSVADK